MDDLITENGALILQQTNFMKLAFVRVLQEAFGHEVTPKEYRWSKIREDRQIWIFRAYPKKTTGLPCIIVETDPADVSIKQLGQEIVGQILSDPDSKGHRTLMYNTYGGVMWMPVNLTIMSENTSDRERITDRTSMYIRYMFRDLFAKNGIEYLDIQAGDGGEEIIDGKPIFIGKITIKCQMEFKQDVSMAMYDAIQKISLNDLRYGVKAEDLEPIG